MSEVYDKLIEDYPNLFSDPSDENSRPLRYFECADGWERLIRTACKVIHNHVTQTEVPWFHFVQIKEKFGGLRLYAYGGDDFTRGVLSAMESLSYSTCEVCGLPGEPNGSGWVRTRCDAHNPDKIDWDSQPLGQKPDVDIARDLHIGMGRVSDERKARNIPKYEEPT